MSEYFKLIKKFIFDVFHPKGNYFRLTFAFAAGMFFRILLMDFNLLPHQVLNNAITQNLAEILAVISAKLFSIISIPVHFDGRNLAIYDTVGVLITNTCLGLRGIILFAFFILTYYGQFIKKIIYILFGFFVIELGNILRICVLAYVQYCCPDKFDFIHYYFSKFIIYSIILILWILWVEHFSQTKLKSFKFIS
ncbi:MAG: hypothetical protein GXO79_01370 [Chlorobi bacterium]|nr:hypothetical protein [Chlorobiota bacterium]